MNKKWGNIDPDFDNDNTINGWKLKVLDVEFFRLERPNMSSFDTDEIQTAINSSLALLDAECNGLIQEVWFITDVESKFYRTGKEKNYIREAAIMQTQYFINLGNDYTDGSTSFNASGISASFQRPLDKKNIAPGVFILLQKGRVYELQSYDLGGNNFGKKPTANSLVNYVQFGVGDVRYVSYNQMPYNRQEGSLLYVEKGEIKFFTPEQLDLTVPRAYLIWDKATKSFEDIHDVKDIAFFGNQLDNAITRQEAEELIAASPSGVSKEYVDDNLVLKADKTDVVDLSTTQAVRGNKTFMNACYVNSAPTNGKGIANKEYVDTKQNKLTAGTGIDITDDVISSTGGGGSGDVTLDTAQNITGIKTFTNGIKNNLIEVDGKSLIIKNSNTSASYLEVESVYSGSGYKNWFGIQFFRTTGTSRPRLANVEIRQDDGLYIDSTADLSFTANNIKFGNARLQGVRTPAADTDAATKKYADDGLALKQNKLTAGTGIDITGDVISSTNGVTLDTDQTITGRKTFTNAITINGSDGKKYFFDTGGGGGLSFLAPNYIINNAGSKNIIGFYKDGFIRCFNNRITEVGTPTANTDAANKKYVDDNVLLKQNKLTAGTGIDITGDTISSTTVVSPDTALTSKTNTFDFRQIIKSGGSGLLDLQNSTGSVLNTTYDLASTSVKLTSPNTTSMTFTAKDFNFSDKEIKNVGTPITNNSAANKEYVDTKQAKLTAGTGIDITDNVISSTGGGGSGDVTLDTAQTITGEKTFSNKLTLNKNLDLSVTGGKSCFVEWLKDGTRIAYLGKGSSSNNTITLSAETNDLILNAGNIEFSGKELKKITTPTADDSAATKKYVDDNLALKADKLVVPINASIDTSTTINDRVVKVVYKEYTSTGDSVVASTSAGFGYLNVSIIRKKSDNSWGIVYNDEFNEVYVSTSNQIRFNIKTLAGYTNEIKLTIQHN